ncbi:MAG: SLBB domain-containing protein [Balneolaceae bacterium]|nr:SLBB domain-containing protein [Balneolaceae bacterium]MCH8549883.1 SLBB domain-containing protein [Balneolaceae bacterium]
MRKTILLMAGLLLALMVNDITAQQRSFNPADLRNVNVSEMSEAEVREADREIRDRGLSLEEFESLAVQQGASRTQVNQLVQRIRSIRAFQDEDDPEFRRDQQRRQSETRMIENLTDMTFMDFEADSLTPDSLRIFGMDLFEQVSVNFEPSFNVPTPRDYSLGAGDQLVIDVWGAAEQTYRLVVSAEGNIRIPNLGPIHVNGMQIDEAEERIINRLTDIYSGINPNNPDQGNTYAQVSLGNVRSIKVTVIGNVKQPGTYTVSSLSTAFNALYASGGPTRRGSFRSVQVIRDNEVYAELDLYDFLVHGTQESNVRLRDQDVIKVDPYQNRVHVWGELKRVGFFELLDGETLDDLITFAAGFTENAYTRSLRLDGTTPSMRRVNTIFYPEGGDTELRSGDKLRVGKIIDRYENRIDLVGAVFRPGVYEYEPGITLYDLIEKADGLKEDAFMGRGVIERIRENREPEALGFNLQQVMDDPARYDIELRPDDVVRISSIFDLQEEQTVRIRGSVNNPRTLQFRENMTIEDVIFRAGGFRDEAAAYRVEVARRVTGGEERVMGDRIAENFRFEVDEHLGFRDEDADFRLQPFDQIYVRAKPNYQEQQTVRIEGEVQFPGEYVLSTRNMTISELVEMAGGFSDYAYPRGASLERILEISAVEQLDFLGAQAAEIEQQRQQVDTLTTPVGIRLAEAMERPSSQYDLILEEGDVLTVPKQLQTVRVEGEVLAPTSIRYDSRRSFRDYVDAAGGTTEEARGRRAYIVYANGEVDRTKRFLFFRRTPDVEPGATIVVPRKPDRREMTAQERVALASSIASTALILVNILDRI